ncbi:MAG: hypothetical protein ABIQ90_09455 [Polaromonas sp.]
MTQQSHPGTSSVDKAAVSPSDESVAGEEDPGAALDMSGSSPSAKEGGSQAVTPASEPLNPGDEAAAGTPGTAENICRECGGSGRVKNAVCPSCNGSGKVIVGVGGA